MNSWVTGVGGYACLNTEAGAPLSPLPYRDIRANITIRHASLTKHRVLESEAPGIVFLNGDARLDQALLNPARALRRDLGNQVAHALETK